MIEGDEQRIKQVIWNFLSNAVKFTPPAGSVALRLGVVDSQAEVVVSDNGEGIEPDASSRALARQRKEVWASDWPSRSTS